VSCAPRVCRPGAPVEPQVLFDFEPAWVYSVAEKSRIRVVSQRMIIICFRCGRWADRIGSTLTSRYQRPTPERPIGDNGPRTRLDPYGRAQRALPPSLGLSVGIVHKESQPAVEKPCGLAPRSRLRSPVPQPSLLLSLLPPVRTARPSLCPLPSKSTLSAKNDRSRKYFFSPDGQSARHHRSTPCLFSKLRWFPGDPPPAAATLLSPTRQMCWSTLRSRGRRGDWASAMVVRGGSVSQGKRRAKCVHGALQRRHDRCSPTFWARATTTSTLNVCLPYKTI